MLSKIYSCCFIVKVVMEGRSLPLSCRYIYKKVYELLPSDLKSDMNDLFRINFPSHIAHRQYNCTETNTLES